MKPRGREARLGFHPTHVTAECGHIDGTAHERRSCACYPKHLKGTARTEQFLHVERASWIVY